MFEFIDVIIAYTESYPEIRATIDVVSGETIHAHLYNTVLGVGVYVESIDEVDKVEWKQIYNDQRTDFIQDHETAVEFLKKYEGDSDDI